MLPGVHELAEAGHECPHIFGEELDIPVLVLPDLENQRVWIQVH
jgi:hypothetical protein